MLSKHYEIQGTVFIIILKKGEEETDDLENTTIESQSEALCCLSITVQ